MSSSTTAQELNLTDALVFEREVQRRLPESPRSGGKPRVAQQYREVAAAHLP